MSPEREVTVIFGGLTRQPSSVTLDGTALECSYDATVREASVKLPALPADRDAKIVLKY